MRFFSSFFGGDQRKDLQRANAQASAEMAGGRDRYNQRMDEAYSLIQPMAERGNEANAMHAALLRGDPEAVQQFQSNPILQGKIAQDSNAMLRYLNARGGATGGRGLAAAQQVAQRGALDFLDRYGQFGQQVQAMGALAGIRQGQGDMEYGYGASKAGQAVNFGNAMAESRNIGVNNLLNLAGVGIKAYTGLR